MEHARTTTPQWRRVFKGADPSGDVKLSQSFPLGASLRHNGSNFSVFSRTATGMELLLFDRAGDARPARGRGIDPVVDRLYHYWHVFVPGVKAGQIYGYRASGPFDSGRGLRFDPTKVLLDPYGRGVVVPRGYARDAAKAHGADNA